MHVGSNECEKTSLACTTWVSIAKNYFKQFRQSLKGSAIKISKTISRSL